MKKLAFILAIPFLFFACSNEPTAVVDEEIIKPQPQFPLPDTTIIVEQVIEDTKQNDSIAPEELIKNGKSEDFIIECEEELIRSAVIDIDYYRESWSDVPNPLIVTYKGSDFGDYFHIMFEDETGAEYDFGFGNNTYTDVQLFLDYISLEDNPKILNQTIKVYWAWKISGYPCCQGGQDPLVAYHPSIIKMEAIKE